MPSKATLTRPTARPFAGFLPAASGWHALVIETHADGTPIMQGAAKTKGRILWMPITVWGLVLADCATAVARSADVQAGTLCFGGFEVVPLSTDVRVQDERGFVLLAPPGETFEQAIARGEAAQLAEEELRTLRAGKLAQRGEGDTQA